MLGDGRISSENHSNQSGTSKRSAWDTIFLIFLGVWGIEEIAGLAKTVKLFGDRGEKWLLGASVLSFIGSLLWAIVALLPTRGGSKLGKFLGGFMLLAPPLTMLISEIVAEYVIHSDSVSLLCGHFGDVVLVGYFTLVAIDICRKKLRGHSLFALRQ